MKKKKRRVAYTVILHNPRTELGLTCNEFCVADSIYHLSNNLNNSAGWCYASKSRIAELLGLSKQTVHKIINKLEEQGLVVRSKKTRHVKTTTLWFESVLLSKGYKTSKENILTSEGQESLHNNNKDNHSNNSDSIQNRLSSRAKIVIDSFIELFLNEFGEEPLIGATEYRVVKTALTKLSAEEAIDLLEDQFHSHTKPTRSVASLQSAFSNNNINVYRAENG